MEYLGGTLGLQWRTIGAISDIHQNKRLNICRCGGILATTPNNALVFQNRKIHQGIQGVNTGVEEPRT